MTKLQKHALMRLIINAKSVTVGSVTYEMKGGVFKRTEEIPMSEVNRLADSADYKLGWNKCYKQMSEMLIFIMTADTASLIKYAGRPKRGDNR